MPRDRRAVIGTAIWNEPRIRSLPYAQQHAYLLAYTQPDLNRCGVIAYRPKRWAGYAKDLTVAHLRRQYERLADERLVVLDEEHEELLVRTYIGHDGLLAQPLVVGAMVRDFAEVTSPDVRLAILRELRRLWDTDLPDGERKGLLLLLGADPAAIAVVADHARNREQALGRIRGAVGDGLVNETLAAIATGQVDPYPDGPREGLPEGLPEGLTDPHAEGHPDPLTRGRSRMAPAPTPSPTPVPVPAPNPHPTNDPADNASQLLTDHAAAYPTPPPPSALIGVRNAINRLIAEGTQPEHIAAGLTRMRDRGLSHRLLPELVAEALHPPKPTNRNSQILDAAMQRAQAAETQRHQRKAIGP